MDLSAQKEQFSHAYVRAVAAVAGFTVAKPEVDDDSVDLSIKSKLHSVRPQVDLQLKCSETIDLVDQTLSFALKQKNYVDLSGNVLVARILVILHVPTDLTQWIEQSEDQMLMRRCAYWVSLAGFPMTENQTSTTIQIPRSQKFTADALKDMMARIAGGERP